MKMSATEYEDSLAHYGILRKSGRYPWGSGENPLQRSKTFLDNVNELRKEGMSDSQIAKAFSPVDENGNAIEKYKLTVADLRALKSRATNEVTSLVARDFSARRSATVSLYFSIALPFSSTGENALAICESDIPSLRSSLTLSKNVFDR